LPSIGLTGARPRTGRAPDPKDWKLQLTESGQARLNEAETRPSLAASIGNGHVTMASATGGSAREADRKAGRKAGRKAAPKRSLRR